MKVSALLSLLALASACGGQSSAPRSVDKPESSGAVSEATGRLRLGLDPKRDGFLYVPFVAFLDRALQWTFERYRVDRARVAVAGFSDGASYALTVGLADGDRFPRVIAFSPGFSAAPELHGKPRVFVSHGTHDTVLPIDRCSRSLVRRLKGEGYAVAYQELDGPHAVPPEIVRDAFAWLGW